MYDNMTHVYSYIHTNTDTTDDLESKQIYMYISYIYIFIHINWNFLKMCTLFPHSLESLEPVKSRGYILTANVSLEYEKSEDGEQKLFGSASDRPSITPWNAVGMSFWWHKKRIIEQFRF